MLAAARRTPTLLSWNTHTIVTRCTAICQSLRLPPALRVSLLTNNSTLLSRHEDIPQRVEFLRKLLGLPGVCINQAAKLCLCQHCFRAIPMQTHPRRVAAMDLPP